MCVKRNGANKIRNVNVNCWGLIKDLNWWFHETRLNLSSNPAYFPYASPILWCRNLIVHCSHCVFQLFREVRIMKTLNHPNIGEWQSRRWSYLWLRVEGVQVCAFCDNNFFVCGSSIVWGDWDWEDSISDNGVCQRRWVKTPPSSHKIVINQYFWS